MTSKRKHQGSDDLLEAEEPPKKVADLDKDASPKDNIDGPSLSKFETCPDNMGKSEHCSNFFSQLPKPQIAVTDTDEPDGDSFSSYKLEKYSRAPPVFIFNNARNRNGSMKDAYAMTQLFDKELKFSVLSEYDSDDPPVWGDLTGKKFKDTIDRYGRCPSYEGLGGVVVVVMTHGREDGTLLFHGEDGSEYTSEVDTQKDLIEVVCQNPTLVGKPKVFIITACRGTSHQPGMGVDGVDGPEDNTLPKNADVLVAYSTSVGQVAIRDEKHGSWYVQEFAKVVKENRKKYHLLDLLTQVQRQVAEKTSQSNGVTKNMPEFISTLCKKLYLVCK